MKHRVVNLPLFVMGVLAFLQSFLAVAVTFEELATTSRRTDKTALT